MFFIKKIFFLIFVICITNLNLNAQSIHSNLTNSDDLKRFKHISTSLMCQCGCKMALSQCNHQTCMAWSMRDIIDKLILNKYSDEQIIQGFVKGFGNDVTTKSEYAILKNEGYQFYIPQYIKGFGPEVLSTPENDRSPIAIFLFTIFALICVFIFIRNKTKKIIINTTQTDHTATQKKLYDSLYK